jgi:regulator of sigma E protease
MSILLFIVILLALVLIHELGHFVVAKLFRIRVDEFAFGFPPRLFSIKKGETNYSFNLLPIGGYVKIHGENPADAPADDPDRERSFAAKPRWAQAAVVLAGVVMNWVLAFLLFWAVLVLGMGISAYDLPEGKTLEGAKLYAVEVLKDSPAEKGGLKAGDQILDIADGDVVLPTDALIRIGGFSGFIGAHPTSTFTIRAREGENVKTLYIAPTLGLNPQASTTPAIGVVLDIAGTIRYGFFEAGKESFVRTWQFTVLTAKGLVGFFAGVVSGSADLTQVTGPVGIVKVVGQAADIGIVPVLTLMALISINLALINLLPFPALDGGRLVFIVLEGIARRPISAVFQGRVNMVGFVLLLLLMVVITYHDIVKL